MTTNSLNVRNRRSRGLPRGVFISLISTTALLAGCSVSSPKDQPQAHFRLSDVDLGNGAPAVPMAVATSDSGLQRTLCPVDAHDVAVSLADPKKAMVIGVQGCMEGDTELGKRINTGLHAVGTAVELVGAGAGVSLARATWAGVKQAGQPPATGNVATQVFVGAGAGGAALATTRTPAFGHGAPSTQIESVGNVSGHSTADLTQLTYSMTSEPVEVAAPNLLAGPRKFLAERGIKPVFEKPDVR